MVGIDSESEGFGSGGLGSAVRAEPLERIKSEAARSRLGWLAGASTSLEGCFGEAGLVSAYERGNGTQIVVATLVLHVVVGRGERLTGNAAPRTSGQGEARGSLEAPPSLQPRPGGYE